jgi:hypothetical protein
MPAAMLQKRYKQVPGRQVYLPLQPASLRRRMPSLAFAILMFLGLFLLGFRVYPKPKPKNNVNVQVMVHARGA